jgi:hypothetical protein
MLLRDHAIALFIAADEGRTPDRTDRLGNQPPLRQQHPDLPELRDDLFRLMLLLRHFLHDSKANFTEDRLLGAGHWVTSPTAALTAGDASTASAASSVTITGLRSTSAIRVAFASASSDIEHSKSTSLPLAIRGRPRYPDRIPLGSILSIIRSAISRVTGVASNATLSTASA